VEAVVGFFLPALVAPVLMGVLAGAALHKAHLAVLEIRRVQPHPKAVMAVMVIQAILMPEAVVVVVLPAIQGLRLKAVMGVQVLPQLCLGHL
jgi:hypothetical protein